MSRLVDVRPGAYHDSVTLMQVSSSLAARPDVRHAHVAMATELNLELLTGMGFDRPAAGPNDLVVALEAHDDESLDAALTALEAALTRRPMAADPDGRTRTPARPLSVGMAARTADGSAPARVALISTPGRVAAIDAADALTAGLDVMLFSDNVPLNQEIALKDLAAASGRLVMGPDCGTAVVDGVGLGFANVVRPGPVGIVAASGTGAQHLMCLLDSADVGVAQCLGVGGRDLSAQVAGRSTHVALDRLAADPAVELVVVVSKPPDPDVAEAVTEHAERLGKPVVVGYLGPGQPDLTETAQRVVTVLGADWRAPERWGPGSASSSRMGSLRGLFAGGTLCLEALATAMPTLGSVSSNLALPGVTPLDRDGRDSGHVLLDLGADEFTAGRPHPMIDHQPRLELLRAALADPDCAALLLDVVLGHAAHPDPASGIAEVIAGSDTPVVVSLVGTRDDPQGLEDTAGRLTAAGAAVHRSNAAAAREAAALATGTASR